jgi:Alanyl-tRNA synthetase
MEQIPQINQHNKKEYPPMHTAEHILNATMVKMFGCPRSKNAHIERKKSKCDYLLEKDPSAEQIKNIEDKVNEIIGKKMDVTVEYLSKEEAANIVDLSKLPDNASQMLRIVRVGDYDACACAGDHVENTSQIGEFKIISSEFTPAQEGETAGKWRVRFKLIEND